MSIFYNLKSDDSDVSNSESYPDVFANRDFECKYSSEENLGNFFEFEEKSAINLMHINTRSIKKNFDKIQELLHNIPGALTAIAITETWLTGNLQDAFFLPGYNFISKCRHRRTGGGVGIFICSTLNYFVRNDLCRMTDAIESIFIKVIQIDRKNIIIGCIYRPPSNDRDYVEMFNSEFCDILKIIDCGKAKTVY